MNIHIHNFTVHFKVPSGEVYAADHISIELQSGKITGLIGESGCGKSVLGLSVLGLLPPYAKVSGDIEFDGIHPLTASEKELRMLRGRKIGLIPQSPSESLNPVRRIGSQLDETLRLVEKNAFTRKKIAKKLLGSFGFENPARIMSAYPFELSGGMQQRVLCAIGVSCSPKWILADEPTKGLDATLCDQVCDTLLGLKKWGVESMLIITHDLALAEKLCDCVAVMYAGEILEIGENVLQNPLHPYTKAFLSSLPQNGMHPMAGTPPKPGDYFAGCKFAPRCPQHTEICVEQRPKPIVADDTMVRCFLYA